MDTFKDKQQLDDMYAKGDAPWVVWKGNETKGPVELPDTDKVGAVVPAGLVTSRRND